MCMPHAACIALMVFPHVTVGCVLGSQVYVDGMELVSEL